MNYADVDRAYVFLFNDNLGCLTNTHEWCRQGVEPQIQNLQCVSAESIDWWVKKIKNYETILIPQMSSLPPEASSIKKSLEVQDILSVAGTPLVNAGKILGFVGFDAVNEEKTWLEDDITILRLISGIIGGAIAQKRSQKLFRRAAIPSKPE